MKPLIASFFIALLAYSLFIDDGKKEGGGYQFGLDKSENHKPQMDEPQPADTLNIYAETASFPVGKELKEL